MASFTVILRPFQFLVALEMSPPAFLETEPVSRSSGPGQTRHLLHHQWTSVDNWFHWGWTQEAWWKHLVSDEPRFWTTKDSCTFPSSKPKVKSVLLMSERIQSKIGRKRKFKGQHQMAITCKLPRIPSRQRVIQDMLNFSKVEVMWQHMWSSVFQRCSLEI